ncbi:hypothetical protein COL516b_010489 [Colletotrichum fioriniae]|nr:uncharacterized protein COL516b_010489 [Colletotrichum fioriniae]KAJ0297637.1 hypothetical protein COL516b_010489 [Colletotrichum fioriniae]
MAEYNRQLDYYTQQEALEDDSRDDLAQQDGLVKQPSLPTRPKPVTANQARLLKEYTSFVQQTASKTISRSRKEKSYESIDRWITNSVVQDILENAKEELIDSPDYSLRTIIRVLKQKYAPSDSSSLTIAREEFNAVMSRANSNVNPTT